MNNEKRICPLLSISDQGDLYYCQGGRCAWWDYLAGACCMASAADYVRSADDNLERISSVLEGGATR